MKKKMKFPQMYKVTAPNGDSGFWEFDSTCEEEFVYCIFRKLNKEIRDGYVIYTKDIQKVLEEAKQKGFLVEEVQ